MGITLATFSVNFLFNIDTAYKFFNRIRAGVSLVSIGTQLCCYIRSIFPTTTCAFKFAFITKNFACTIAEISNFVEYGKRLPCMIAQLAFREIFRKCFVYLNIRYIHVFPVIIILTR